MARGPSQFPSVASSIVERGRGVITTRGRLAAASLDRAQLHRERRHLARAQFSERYEWASPYIGSDARFGEVMCQAWRLRD